eukprot:10324751-Karenia_brevis.AAC.1
MLTVLTEKQLLVARAADDSMEPDTDDAKVLVLKYSSDGALYLRKLAVASRVLEKYNNLARDA